MKLKEILREAFENYIEQENPTIEYLGPTLKCDVLGQMKDALMQVDEFKDVDELVILTCPNVLTDNGKTLISQSYKISESAKFKKRCYLYSISLTPEIFYPEAIYMPVKNGACISPVMYDPNEPSPKKKIVLDCFLESIQDDFNSKKQQLHDLLDDVLSNPEEYRVKGERGLIVRGIFEEIESEYGKSGVEIGSLTL